MSSSLFRKLARYRCRPLLMAASTSVGLTLALAGAAADETAQSGAEPAPESSVVMGVGLVIDLPGTGDAAVDHTFVESSIVGVLKRAGLDLWPGQIKPGRIAKVMVTAELPADAADGKRVVVSVTAIGDATSLAGGMLLATPLRDEDGKIYTVGQGAVEVGNQVADVELSEQPVIAARIGVLADGAILDTNHPSAVAFD